MARHWIVICPERQTKGGLWRIWYRENCVAIGWPPSSYHPDGPTDRVGWRSARECLRKMEPGDTVIPYLQKWRVGPFGVIRTVHLADEEWNPTVPEGAYALNPDEPELGRRIEVDWQTQGMPPGGKAALIPPGKRLRRPDALYTVEELKPERHAELVGVLGDKDNWVSVGEDDELVPDPLPGDAGDAQLKVLEDTLQRVLTQNLSLEPGLAPHAEYPLQEFMTDVGRIDILCVDKAKRLVVIELKSGHADDRAVGQIARYMGWVKQNLPEGPDSRGILVCLDATAGGRAAALVVPNLQIMLYQLACTVQPLK